ncbi:MAG: SirB2 family protein [Betaproteobacteria bacterium]|nr:SirB2 family protein [Betaproteobacteria bacterium]
MDYAVLMQVHVACAVLSYAGFFTRGVWMIRDSPLLERRWVRIVPHVNDTILLAAAIALAVMLRQYPLVHGWLTAKVIGLVFYILLGMAALRPGRTKSARVAAWIGAQAAFLYIVAVAYTRNPLVLL